MSGPYTTVLTRRAANEAITGTTPPPPQLSGPYTEGTGARSGPETLQSTTRNTGGKTDAKAQDSASGVSRPYAPPTMEGVRRLEENEEGQQATRANDQPADDDSAQADNTVPSSTPGQEKGNL